jgi:hypothetical protein
MALEPLESLDDLSAQCQLVPSFTVEELNLSKSPHSSELPWTKTVFQSALSTLKSCDFFSLQVIFDDKCVSLTSWVHSKC